MAHPDVWYSGFHEDVAFAHESVPRIKRFGMGLRVQHHRLVAALSCFLHQRIQDRAAYSCSTHSSGYGHASDVAVRQQSSGSYGLSILAKNHRMQAETIHLVPFHRDRNILLNDEYGVAHRSGMRLLCAPIPESQPEFHCASGGNFSSLVMTARQSSGTGTPLRTEVSAYT